MPRADAAPASQPNDRPTQENIALDDKVADAGRYSRTAFDDYAFGGDQGIDALRRRLDSLLSRRVELAAATRRLSSDQQEKLRLAGKGDIKRFFEQIDRERAQFDAVRGSEQAARTILLRVKSRDYRHHPGPWGYGSLFAKMQSKIEDDKKNGSNPPLPGSSIEVADAVEQARLIAIVSDVKGLTRSQIQDLSFWCAGAKIDRYLTGDGPRGEVVFKAIPVATWERLSSGEACDRYVVFIKSSDSAGTGHLQVIKMLRATEENIEQVSGLSTSRSAVE